MSLEPTDPATLFGGTWERIQGRFLLAASDEYEAGSSGGEATHKLTVSEMPSHGHNYSQFVYYNTIPTNYTDAYLTGMGRAFSITTGATTAVGSGVAHNNMPPYRAVYMWRRRS